MGKSVKKERSLTGAIAVLTIVFIALVGMIAWDLAQGSGIVAEQEPASNPHVATVSLTVLPPDDTATGAGT